jgi:diacylglycerol kinase (ATP)
VRALLVVNANARRGAALGAVVRTSLARLGVDIVEDERSPGGFDAIVVAGGDGTLAREIPRALAFDVPVGIVPLGTFNDVARALGLPLDVDGACEVIASGRTRRIDAARVNGAYFLTEASIGISSRLARAQRPRDKQRFGIWAILASLALIARATRPFRIEVEHDGKYARVRAVQVTVANSQRFGGIIVVGDAAIDDGWLDCYTVEVGNLAQLFSVVAAIAGGRRRSRSGLRTFRSTAFEIFTGRPHHISADGEPAGTTPARFEILRAALRVFSPETG